jgi:hypothetical protein
MFQPLDLTAKAADPGRRGELVKRIGERVGSRKPGNLLDVLQSLIPSEGKGGRVFVLNKPPIFSQKVGGFYLWMLPRS